MTHARASQGEQDGESGFGGAPHMPARLLLLPMRTVGVFPGISGPLSVGRAASVQVVEAAFADEKLIGLMAQRDPTEDKPRPAGLYSVGVAARAGITTVILPQHNEKDLTDAPQGIREKIQFLFVDEIYEATRAS